MSGRVDEVRQTLSPQERLTLDTYEAQAEAWGDARSGADFWAPELAIFAQMLPSGRVLDIGSGNGRDARLLIDSGFDYTGVDISGELLKLARRNCPDGRFEIGNVYDLPFADESFDGAWVSAILLHLPKKRLGDALDEIHRVLRGGAIAFITVKLGEGEGVEDGRLGRRFFALYEPEEMTLRLEHAGFDVERWECHERGGARWLCFWARRAG